MLAPVKTKSLLNIATGGGGGGEISGNKVLRASESLQPFPDRIFIVKILLACQPKWFIATISHVLLY